MADKNVKFLVGTETNFTTTSKKPENVPGSVYLTTVDNGRGYMYYGDGTNFLNIVPKLLSVSNGGTGRNTLTKGYALLGNGTSSVELRPITNNTGSSHISASTNLITANTLAYWDGSYDNSDDHKSRIIYLGTVTKGVWNASTIVVGKGGTGKTTLTQNGVVYGNAANPVGVTAAGAQGTVLCSTGTSNAPAFAAPTVSWVGGNSSGPTFRFNIGNKNYDAVIPSASEDASGIVTTGTQTFNGGKTFTVDMNTSSVVPIVNNKYESGSSTAQWKIVHSNAYYLYDSNKNQIGSWYCKVAGTAASGNIAGNQGEAYFVIGNNKAYTAAGNSKGFLVIYNRPSSTTAGYKTTLHSQAKTSDKTVAIPNYTGNMVIADTAYADPTSETSYKIPFYTADHALMGINGGFRAQVKKGTTSVAGVSNLVLGNSTKSGSNANSRGGIVLYDTGADCVTITKKASGNTSATAYSFEIPKPSDATSTWEFMYHKSNESIGSTNQPVYVTSSGLPAVVTSVAVSYGGTGKTTLTSNGILYGQGTGAVAVTAAGGQGTILSPNASGVPSFASPSWSWTAGTTAGPTLTLSIQSKNWTTAAIPSASNSASGIVTTGAQTFAGVKTFANTTASTAYNKGAVVIGGGLGVAGNIYSNGNLNMTGTGEFGGDITVEGGEIYLGSSATDRVTMSYANDTLTITFIE